MPSSRRLDARELSARLGVPAWTLEDPAALDVLALEGLPARTRRGGTRTWSRYHFARLTACDSLHARLRAVLLEAVLPRAWPPTDPGDDDRGACRGDGRHPD